MYVAGSRWLNITRMIFINFNTGCESVAWREVKQQEDFIVMNGGHGSQQLIFFSVQFPVLGLLKFVFLFICLFWSFVFFLFFLS